MMTPELLEKVTLLEEKFAASGQDLKSYLDGLLYADYLTYWDYIHLDTLLSLQTPRTSFPDEEIFIMYHQITELYFKLCLHELKQLVNGDEHPISFILERTRRINQYFKALISSFDIMVQGMDKDQFLKFRMSLLPASGFQSAQYRTIEIYATDFRNLVHHEQRDSFRGTDNIDELFGQIYWKRGATELASGKKTLTLLQFEEKYGEHLLNTAIKLKGNNLFGLALRAIDREGENEELIKELRQLDLNVNVNWPLMHYKSAVRYLERSPADIAATGGTNWQKYLPPRFQLRIFYPSLWSEEELANWGKNRE
ncbi:MAG: tryptophan 2,3-dioxygenase family protein [Bacteroidota bacterium]